MVRLRDEDEHELRKTEMQPRFPSPSLSTGLQAAGPFPPGPAATILICLVMASGAVFGMAAQISLQRLGLDFDSIRSDVHAHRAATAHFAVAWWAWGLFPLGAFFIGPLCVAATRAIGGGGQLMRGLRWFATAIAVLGFAAVAQPRSFPPAAPVAANTVVSLLVVIGSTLLALLGAWLLGGISRDRTATPSAARVGGRLCHLQGSTPRNATPPGREGSANNGLPLLRARRRHRLVHQRKEKALQMLAALVQRILRPGDSVVSFPKSPRSSPSGH